MLTTFFASAVGGAPRPEAPSAATNTRNKNKQSRIGRAMDVSSCGKQATGERDVSPGRTREDFEDHRAERDSNMTTSVESVQDGATGGRACSGRCRCCPALPREWPLRYTGHWLATSRSIPERGSGRTREGSGGRTA